MFRYCLVVMDKFGFLISQYNFDKPRISKNRLVLSYEF